MCDMQTILPIVALTRNINNNDDKNNMRMKTRKHVRFQKEVTVRILNKRRPPSSSCWLAQKDYDTIQNGIMMTLDFMNLTDGFNNSSTTSSSSSSLSLFYCSRGLEKYSCKVINRGCLKPEILLRRLHAVHAVLYEHEESQKRREQDQADENIRYAYRNYTREDTEHALSMGRYDEEDSIRMIIEPSASDDAYGNGKTTDNATDNSSTADTSTYTNLFRVKKPDENKWNLTRQ
jgi:hypothetical protein